MDLNSDPAVLLALQDSTDIIINMSEFSLGRALNNSFIFYEELCISRCHCVFQFDGTRWSIIDRSSYGTTVNFQTIHKNSNYTIKDGDIIHLTDTIAFKFSYPFLGKPHSQSRKKRRIESIEGPDISNIEDVNVLKNELIRDKAALSKLMLDSKEMQNKIVGLEIELFNKTTSTIKLEQEIVDLKANCAILEQEKEELELQLTVAECESNLLKNKLDDKSKLENEETEDEDKKLLSCVLRVEISNKEIDVKTKLTNVIQQIKCEKELSLINVQNYLMELQNEVDELITKRSELENNCGVCSINSSKTEMKIEKIKEDMFNTMETELQCSICNELFIKPALLNCGHMFCKACISLWRKQKDSCPVCRVPIKSWLLCIALDNYVDQTMELLLPSRRNTRAKLKESHAAIASKSGQSPDIQELIRSPTIYVSSDDGSDSNTDDESDYGSEMNYYGGHGFCFICRDPGHWANSCPQRRGRR